MARARKKYSSDLQDSEWRIIRHLIPVHTGAGRKMTLPLREVLDAIFFIVRTGSQWRELPGDFPQWQSVYYLSRDYERLLDSRASMVYLTSIRILLKRLAA